jgi:hypothetical protein
MKELVVWQSFGSRSNGTYIYVPHRAHLDSSKSGTTIFFRTTYNSSHHYLRGQRLAFARELCVT